jgi:hypothetical protein
MVDRPDFSILWGGFTYRSVSIVNAQAPGKRLIGWASQSFIPILLAYEPGDFRKGVDSLVELCKNRFDQDPFSGSLFVFRNRSGTALKLLVYDGQGYWLCLVAFARADCSVCVRLSQCASAKGRRRTVNIKPKDLHEALQQNRQREKTKDFKEEYSKWAGVEGTISQGGECLDWEGRALLE